jgi:hypothetical protein
VQQTFHPPLPIVLAVRLATNTNATTGLKPKRKQRLLLPSTVKKHGTKPLAHAARQAAFKSMLTPLCTVSGASVATLARHLKKVHNSITERYNKFRI